MIKVINLHNATCNLKYVTLRSFVSINMAIIHLCLFLISIGGEHRSRIYMTFSKFSHPYLIYPWSYIHLYRETMRVSIKNRSYNIWTRYNGILILFQGIPKLRKKLRSKILISLCSSLTFLLIVFLAGIERKETKFVPCQIIAALLHYFLLTSLAWMCVAAASLYIIVSRPFYFRSQVANERCFFLGASIMAWGEY